MTRKAVMIIAFQGFRDEEYAEPKAVLENAGIQVTTASTQLGTAKGKLGMSAKVDITLDQVKIKDYDAILFIGGPGCYDFHDDPLAQGIAKEAIKQGKVLGAICAAVAILAKAGLLKGVKSTSFSGVSDILKSNGALYSPSGLEVAGKIITADGPAHARQFGEEIAKALKF